MNLTRLYLTATLLLLFCVFGAGVTYFLSYHPDRTVFPVRGIDVSHHQGPISWPQVALDDVAFVYMKATEGGDFVDPRFAENWARSDQAGIPRGAYHFFTFCRPAEIQARNYIATVPVDEMALPPALDLEYTGNCKARPTVLEMAREIETWLRLVESHYGQPAIIYVTRDFYHGYLKPSGIERRLWLRSLARPPGYGGEWSIWQYHNRGCVAGISGPVDLNVARNTDLFAVRHNHVRKSAVSLPPPHENNRPRPIQ